MTQNTNLNPGPNLTGPPVPPQPTSEAQWQSAHAAAPNQPAPAPATPNQPAPPPAAQEAGDGKGKGDGRPSNLMLAGAGSLLAVLAFIGGTAVGHAWDGSSTQQNQFGGPGGGRQFPSQQGQIPGQQGQIPGQQGQQGQVPSQQGQVPGQGVQPGDGTGDSDGQTQTS